MKINGKVVPLIDNPDTDAGGKVVDTAALKATFAAEDAAGFEKRWESYVKGFGEALAVKAPWYPIFDEATHAFWKSSKQFLYERITSTVVLDMIWDRVRKDREISVEDYAGVKGLLAEFLAENTSLDHAIDAIMWKDAAKGPGAKPYFNPHLRAAFTAHQD